MSLDGEVAVGVLANALYDGVRWAVTVLRARDQDWTDAVIEEVERAGVALADDERKRLAQWLRTWDVEAMAEAEAGPRADLVRTLNLVVLGTGDPKLAARWTDPVGQKAINAERAERLAGVLWAAIVQGLDADERRRVCDEVAALRGNELAAAALDQLGLLTESVTGIRDEVMEALRDLDRRLAPGLPLERARLRPPAAQRLSPYELLWARYGVVPYDDRAGWLDDLTAWCEELAPLSIRVVTGAGGMGKTRLALELCRRMSGRGWVAGLLSTEANPASNSSSHGVTRGEMDALAAERAPRLIVIDYAELRPQVVEALVDTLGGHRPLRSEQVRILLLVRRRETSDDPRRWFGQGRQDTTGSALSRAGLLRLSLPASRDGSAAVDFGPAARHRLFRAAADRFAAVLETDAGRSVEPPADLGGETYRSPLMVLVAAALAADPDGALRSGLSSEDLLSLILDRERALHWADAPESEPVLVERAVAIVTLLGASTETEAIAHLGSVAAFGDEGSRERLALWMRRLYDGPLWLNPLEPDPLGEHLVSRYTDESLVRYALTLGATASGTRACNVLAAVAVDYPRHRDMIKDVLRQELNDLCGAAVEQEAVASEPGQPLLADALTALVGTVHLGAERVELPDRLGVASTRLAVQLHTTDVHELRAQLQSNVSEGALERFAGTLNDLSNRLAELRRNDEALPYIEEAVATFRRLAELDAAGWLPYLAMALNNLSNRLSELGRRPEALPPCQESVRAFRNAVEQNSELWLEDLGKALNNLSNRLADLGLYDDALPPIREAVITYRRLTDGGQKTLLPELAASLTNLSNRLASLDQEDDALPPIQEALTIYRELARARPTVWRPVLAVALSNLSIRLGALDRNDDALEPAQEAVNIRRQLAEANPSVWAVDLASSLNTLSNRLGALGHHDDALEAVEEAHATYALLVKSDPDRWLPSLAITLNNLAVRLASLGRHDEALAQLQASIAIRRDLAGTDPLWRPDLVGGLTFLAAYYLQLGRPKDAEAVRAELNDLVSSTLEPGSDAGEVDN